MYDSVSIAVIVHVFSLLVRHNVWKQTQKIYIKKVTTSTVNLQYDPVANKSYRSAACLSFHVGGDQTFDELRIPAQPTIQHDVDIYCGCIAYCSTILEVPGSAEIPRPSTSRSRLVKLISPSRARFENQREVVNLRRAAIAYKWNHKLNILKSLQSIWCLNHPSFQFAPFWKLTEVSITADNLQLVDHCLREKPICMCWVWRFKQCLNMKHVVWKHPWQTGSDMFNQKFQKHAGSIHWERVYCRHHFLYRR